MKRDQWFLLASVLMFTGVGIYYLRPRWLPILTKRPTISAVANSQSPQALSQAAVDTKLAGVSEMKAQGEVIDESTPWGRNPFLTEEEVARAKMPPAGEVEGVKVKAIIAGTRKSVATIDGKTVAVGEKIGEETVVEIRPDSVVLEMDGTKRVLKVSESSISIEVKEVKR